MKKIQVILWVIFGALLIATSLASVETVKGVEECLPHPANIPLTLALGAALLIMAWLLRRYR
jgi:type IV secretory pathway VirB6-like protein